MENHNSVLYDSSMVHTPSPREDALQACKENGLFLSVYEKRGFIEEYWIDNDPIYLDKEPDYFYRIVARDADRPRFLKRLRNWLSLLVSI